MMLVYGAGQVARPASSTAGTEPSKGHFQDALLTLVSAHAHFGHVQVPPPPPPTALAFILPHTHCSTVTIRTVVR